jgi:hypothetical protein
MLGVSLQASPNWSYNVPPGVKGQISNYLATYLSFGRKASLVRTLLVRISGVEMFAIPLNRMRVSLCSSSAAASPCDVDVACWLGKALEAQKTIQTEGHCRTCSRKRAIPPVTLQHQTPNLIGRDCSPRTDNFVDKSVDEGIMGSSPDPGRIRLTLTLPLVGSSMFPLRMGAGPPPRVPRSVVTSWGIPLLTPFWSAKHLTRTVAVPSTQGRTVRAQGPDGPRTSARRGDALCTGADGPRVRAGRSAAWCKARAPARRPDDPRPEAGRSARAQGRRKIVGGAWISLPGGTPSGRRDPRSCLGSGRPN